MEEFQEQQNNFNIQAIKRRRKVVMEELKRLEMEGGFLDSAGFIKGIKGIRRSM